jgi:CDP-diacylglycerol--glycerol-3-phosphate 3-phosphatidyltransferase
VDKPPGRPLVTANQVTLGRLAAIPLCAYLLFQGHDAQIAAVILGTLIGCTDFVDGFLARKYGTTKLGGLMDPIADKVFTAVVFLPAVDLGWVAPWLVALLFTREFLVTAARTSYERRGLQLKSSYLARYKTWVQMCGIGVILFTNVLQPATTDFILGALAVAPIIGWAVLRVVYKRSWKGAGFFAVSFAGCLAVHHIFGPHAFATWLMYFVVAITWMSGLGYLTGVGQLKGRGRIQPREVIRLITAITIPIGTVLVEMSPHSRPLFTLLILSCELAHGGLDNLLATQKAEAGAWAWGVRTVAISSLLALGTLDWWFSGICVMAAALIAVVGVVDAFIRKRRFYLDSFAAEGTVVPEDSAAAPQ